MANLNSGEPIPFPEFPEDIQLCILSFLTPSEISSFACTSKRFLSLCRSDPKLWFSMCHRRFGSKTRINKWGSGNIQFKHLYKTLTEYENLIGFWRVSTSQTQTRTPNSVSNKPPALVFFEWGESFVIGSRVTPSNNGNYDVVKLPFLWMGISPKGEIVNFLEPNSQVRLDLDSISFGENAVVCCNGNDLVLVDVNRIGEFHIVIEERVGFGNVNVMNEEMVGVESGSSPDGDTSEFYQYFANRTSPSRERSSRRQRRREKERNGSKKWESEHFVKIVNYSPTSGRPLQGLWKGICEDANLDFYLVAYDDIGGIACRRIGDSCKPFSSYAPVFWTSNTTVFESPFSSEEEYIYDTREHLLPLGQLEMDAVSRILYINSSYDLVLPGLVEPTSVNPNQVEGRIWQYGDGTFGFGFLRDNHIINLKHIAVDGCLLDAMQRL